MWTSSRDEWLHNWRKESTTSSPCITVRTHWDLLLLQLSFAKARSGPVLGQEKPLECTFPLEWHKSHQSTELLALPALPWVCSSAQQRTAVCGRKRAAGRWNQATTTEVHEQTSARSHSSFLWFPESQTAFSTNKQPSKATWEQAQAGQLPEGRTLYWKVRSH